MNEDNAIMTLDYFLHSPVKDIQRYNDRKEKLEMEIDDEEKVEAILNNWMGWYPRNILVIDEAHFLSSKLADFFSLSITDKGFPGFNYRKVIQAIEERKKTLTPADSFSRMVVEEFGKEFRSYCQLQDEEMRYLETILEDDSMTTEEYNYQGKDMPIEEAMQKHKKFLYKLGFVVTTIEPDVEFVYSHDDNGFYLKPYSAKDYVKPVWDQFDHIILSSATLFDVHSYLEDLGLDKYKWKQVDVSAPFNPENGPIFKESNLYLSMKNFDSTIDSVTKKVDEILDNHKHERGIIHCFSEKYRKSIYERTQNKDRMVLHDSFNRQEVLKNFTTNVPDGDNAVLLSVNMGEGVDLKDDIARFQIIVKCPYLPMGDPWIKLHMERSGRWYRNQAIIELMQMAGRIVRSKEDFGYTYIIDANAWNLLQNNRQELQEHHSWFTSRMDAGMMQQEEKNRKMTESLYNDILGD
jgi:Rad3-related DNA helicase